MNYSDETQVGSVITDNYSYLITSVYISLDKEFKSEELGTMNGEEYLALLNFIIKDGENIVFFINVKKLIGALGKNVDVFKEYDFPFPFLVTIHLHNMKKVAEGILNHYFSENLIIDKLTRTLEGKFYTNCKLKNGDENLILEKSKEELCLYKLSFKNN